MSLTKYPQGSIRELLSISWPLMISSLSVMMMVFVDRILLATYSKEAFNAAVNASTLGWAFTFGAISIATIAEVFVAQYNGAKEYKRIGEPVWQMIWFGVLTSLVFMPLSFWGADFVYPKEAGRGLENDYFSWMVFFSPSYALYGALAAFFIGRGKSGLISILAFATNFVNLFFDMIMIFGIEGWFPSLGVKGAAIATSLANLFQVAVLLYIFLKKENREQFGTNNFAFSFKPFLQCMRIGLPGGSSGMFEVLGWAAFYEMLSFAGPSYITAAGIFQSCFILLFFLPEGLSKGLAAICGNLIGAGERALIPAALKSGVIIIFAFLLCLLALYPLVVDTVIAMFVFPVQDIEVLRIALLATIVCIFFDGLRFVITGVLTAAGDTLFLLVANFGCIWLFLVIPTYFFVIIDKVAVPQALSIAAVFSGSSLLLFIGRYFYGSWKEIELIDRSR